MKYFILALLAMTVWMHCLTFDRFQPSGLMNGFVQSCHPRQGTNSDFTDNLSKYIPLPKLDGTCDIYPLEAVSVIASGNDYFPRPNLQSYEAYSAKLAELDSAHLRGDKAPDNIFFSISAGPNFPAMDDGLSWPEIWTRYDASGLTVPGWNCLVLKKTPVPRHWEKVLIAEADAGFNQFLQIPTGLIWAEIDFKKTAYGKLQSALYKCPTLAIGTASQGALTPLGQIIPGVAQGGFLLSPLVNDGRQFTNIMAGDYLPARQLNNAMFYINGDYACWQPKFHIKIFHIKIFQ